MNRASASLAGFVLASLVAGHAQGEGTADLNEYQGLFRDTELYVDIDDASREQICWTGHGSIEVINASGTSLGTVASGSCVNATTGVSGAYEIRLGEHQLECRDCTPTDLTDDPCESCGAITVNSTYSWDIAVRDRVSAATIEGRLWSDGWQFGTPGFASTYATNGSFYAAVPGGTPGEEAVVELRLRGLSGYVYTVLANRTGVEGDNAGRSVPQASTVVFREFPLYLNPPDLASYSSLAPLVTGFGFSGGPAGCDSIAPEVTTGTFSFNSNVEGSFHIVCDLDGNGEYYDPEDLLIVRTSVIGTNTVEWDGLDNNGDPVEPGNYDCRVRLNVGEFHYVGIDIETSYPGMRMFEVEEAGVRRPLFMHWDDTLVSSADIPMENGDLSPDLSPLLGLDSQSPSLEATPYGELNPGNARAWGAFATSSPRGKGDESYLDTYTWLYSTLSGDITVGVVDSLTDRDGDGLTDVLEDCTLGTNPEDPDTDHDNIGDYEETNGGARVDTDGDSTIDALDDDSDDDGIDDIDEAGDDELSTPAVDTDGDTTPDYRDIDRDGDGDNDNVDCDPDDPDVHHGATELCNGEDDNCNGVIDEGLPDSDGDGVPDCRDDDRDGDGDPDSTDCEPDDPDIYHGATEYCDGVDNNCDGSIDEGFPDYDGDGEADCDEVDTDGDGDPDSTDCEPGDPEIHHGAEEVCDGVDNNCDGEEDEGFDENGNGIADCLEIDTDGDGLFDVVEIEWGTDPNDADSDDDGIPDGEEGEPGTEGREWNDDNDGDGLINALDPDSDDDGILDGTEAGLTEPGRDTDVGRGNFVADEDPTTTTDPLNPDTDGGGVSDGEEDANHNGAVDEGERHPEAGWGWDDNPGLAGGGCFCSATSGSPSLPGGALPLILAALGLALLRRR